MPNLDLADIKVALRACWCRETAWTPSDWPARNPAAGQCWSSAYAVCASRR